MRTSTFKITKGQFRDFLMRHQSTKFIMVDCKRCLGGKLLRERYPTARYVSFGADCGTVSFYPEIYRESDYWFFKMPKWLGNFITEQIRWVNLRSNPTFLTGKELLNRFDSGRLVPDR